MKHLKTFENKLQDKVDDYYQYIDKWVVIKSLNNNKITIAMFKNIQKDNYVYLYIPKDSPFGVGGHCGVHISAFEILDSCDDIKDTEEMLNIAKIKEDAKKYNL